MTIDKGHIIFLAVGLLLGFASGFFTGKSLYQTTDSVKIERDTVLVTDTIRYFLPTPKDSIRTKFVTRWLPVVEHDTALRFVEHHDTVAVEVPITSKHYESKDYDAWVSGYEPRLDSIKVYQRTEYITETITKTIKGTKHFFLDVGGGCEYLPNTNAMVPFAELGFKFKKGRVGAGVYGGYAHDLKENKAEPLVKAKVTYDLFSF